MDFKLNIIVFTLAFLINELRADFVNQLISENNWLSNWLVPPPPHATQDMIVHLNVLSIF